MKSIVIIPIAYSLKMHHHESEFSLALSMALRSFVVTLASRIYSINLLPSLFAAFLRGNNFVPDFGAPFFHATCST